MNRHQLKTWPEYFNAVRMGEKRFEVRKNDRDFQVGDLLTLMEYDPKREQYTGRQTERYVAYILRGPGFGIEDGYVVLSLSSDVPWMGPRK